ncbi:DUF4249 domain-containing protein [Hyunsoonleella sp. SJ7]|uniref:DUF4249 domain-containing protein n=1 Tax=Hyunsoonleella aquatilis TaxID=2762758 RepID=A0A923KML6_9FLAO|nr:DUF4249 domain-containing protein [Hyunsoonleella aquatilis]MBC3759893.1 DUF4249 domain-containing protein [Hyunsoonleella aquatilis]
MKPLIKSFLILFFVGLTSCEDVIDVDVPTSAPRLVIEASLDWEKGTTGNNQVVKLSTSTPYFENSTNPTVTGASVKVTNNNSSAAYTFVDQNDGTYTISNFVPVINDSYTLEVEYNGEMYRATETLKSVSPIKRVEQSLEGGFDDEVLDVSIFWDDPADEENFYLIKFIEQGDLVPEFEDYPDEFVNGNELDTFFEKDEDENDGQGQFMPGDVVEFTLYGISEQYDNYISLLIEQYDADGDPFSAIPSKLKGNCINITTPENYAFGYFRLSEFDRVSYTFQ